MFKKILKRMQFELTVGIYNDGNRSSRRYAKRLAKNNGKA